VLMRSRLEGLGGHSISGLKLYVRFDPTLNGNGGGGDQNAGADSGGVATSGGHTVLTGSDPVTTTNAANRDYAVPVHSALDASGGFAEASNGFAGGASDGLTQLDGSHALTSHFTTAEHGNLVQTGRVRLGGDGRFRLALSFGDTEGKALNAARASLGAPFGDISRAYRRGWHAYDRALVRPHRPAGVSRARWRPLLDEYYLSANYVKAAEDKTFLGAEAAALASPWGQAISAGSNDNPGTYFGSYREVFARDLYEAWTSMFLAGDWQTARDMTRFLFVRQQLPDGSMPRNSLTNGKTAPDSFNTQLDECSYPLVMALAVHLTGRSFYVNHIRPAADFVISHGPSFGPERWEEQPGFSPSTISAEIAGLIAAARIADMNGDHASAIAWRGVADEFQRNLKKWTLTTTGPLSPEPYFIRIAPTGDPNAAVTVTPGNGHQTAIDQQRMIDAGFLEYARLGLLPTRDPDIVNSLRVVDATILFHTATGDGFHRYNDDGYGDGNLDGHPWAPSDKGDGHIWPVLAGERGQYELDSGEVLAAVRRLEAMRGGASGVGLIPEQVWDQPDLPASPFGTDPTVASIGFVNGQPAGSAQALTWSAGQFVRLMLDVSADRVLDRPSYTTNRYVNHHQGQTRLTVTSPADQSAIHTTSVAVTGTTAPHNKLVVVGDNLDHNTSRTTVTGHADGAGNFSLALPVTGGTTVINTVAVDWHGGTARDVRTVALDEAPGTRLLQVDDPLGDDFGPGKYAYPTSDNFHPGAFDIEQFQVFDDGTKTIFRVKTRDLHPTFGSPLGAQLVDVYVHEPGASPTSTQPSFGVGARHYLIDASGAWSRLLEVQGFGQRFIDAAGNTVGSIAISANAISRYITFSVPHSALGGTPAPGWGFTVVLTGQDGFSSDQARGFQPTPQPFQFGVCATASSDPHCTVDPGTVPKAMDTLTLPSELDYTLHAPVLTPVVIP
jgi:glucoamylase